MVASQRFRPAAEALAELLSAIPSGAFRRHLVGRIYDRDCDAVLDSLGSRLHGGMTLGDVAVGLRPDQDIGFEDLMGLFPSSPLSYGVALMTPRQVGYIFSTCRRAGVRTALEIGRYKGGTTVVIAAAIGPAGVLWSIDDGSVEGAGLTDGRSSTFDDEIREFCDRFGWQVNLMVGNSRTFELDIIPDLVLIDGDHSYAGAKADFERWGRKVRVGGHVLLDDSFPLGRYSRHNEDIGRVIQEALDSGEFRLVNTVDRLGHLQKLS